MRYIPIVFLTLSMFWFGTVVHADITLDHTDRSNVRSNGGKLAGSYAVRALNLGAFEDPFDPAGTPQERERNYHTFDLSGLSGTITGATLRVWIDPKDGDPGSGQGNETGAPYQSSDPFEDILLYDVSTDASTLASASPGIGAFEDLGTGSTYGTLRVAADDAGEYIEAVLNAQAITDLNAAIGGSWSVGGALDFNGSYGANSSFISERVLHDDNILANDLPSQLVLTGSVVPEPSSVLLLICAASLAMARRPMVNYLHCKSSS